MLGYEQQDACLRFQGMDNTPYEYLNFVWFALFTLIHGIVIYVFQWIALTNLRTTRIRAGRGSVRVKCLTQEQQNNQPGTFSRPCLIQKQKHYCPRSRLTVVKGHYSNQGHIKAPFYSKLEKCEKKGFRKRSSSRRNLKTLGLRFSVNVKHFKNGAF